ncbi:MAG TPA: hypothetical protein VGB91_15670, partial [Rhizomicrobium sp.]
MVWNISLQRLAALAATVLFSSVLLSGCVADSPRTHLDWYPQADGHRHGRVATARPTPKPRETRVAVHRR